MADTLGVKLTNVDSTALEASHVLRAGPGILYALTGINTNVAARFIQLFDSATLPADGAVPAVVISAPANPGNFAIDFGTYGRSFTTGIVVCNSTTLATKTIGAADTWFNSRLL